MSSSNGASYALIYMQQKRLDEKMQKIQKAKVKSAIGRFTLALMRSRSSGAAQEKQSK